MRDWTVWSLAVVAWRTLAATTSDPSRTTSRTLPVADARVQRIADVE